MQILPRNEIRVMFPATMSNAIPERRMYFSGTAAAGPEAARRTLAAATGGQNSGDARCDPSILTTCYAVWPQSTADSARMKRANGMIEPSQDAASSAAM